MSKIAVIDIGSNSVRLVVYDALSRAPNYVFNEKAICKLGAGLRTTGHLSPEGVIAAKSALERFVTLARAMRVQTIEAVATAAMREARDGPAFVNWALKNLDLDIRVVSGEDEGRLSANGVLLGWPQADGLVCDIGGSSMELVHIDNGEIGASVSTPLGPLRLADIASADDVMRFIDDELNTAQRVINWSGGRIYLVGGSWRALGRVDMARREYPFRILHEYILDVDDIHNSIALIQNSDVAELTAMSGASQSRGELLPAASMVLGRLIDVFAPDDFAISSYGLREGLLREQMPRWMRLSDPLIAVCETLEIEKARFPGYGRHLYDWLKPLYKDIDAARDRLILAACLLHDTNWRFPSDFRAQLGFEVVAQSNFSGVTHQERLFLALALAARYEKNPEYAFSHDAIALLPDEDIDAARALGQAMRLGAMISGAIVGLLDATHIQRVENRLILTIEKRGADIFDTAVQKRLNALGTLMDARVEIEFK